MFADWDRSLYNKNVMKNDDFFIISLLGMEIMIFRMIDNAK